MRCQRCGCRDDKVIDSRSSREGTTIRRRRECLSCNHRFTTYEEVEHAGLLVIKRDGTRQDFSKDKLESGIRKACEKRPVSSSTIEELVDRIVFEVSDKYDREAPSMVIGEMIMQVLREVDEVAFVRFASIYRRFEEAGDFVQAVKKLERRNDTTTIRLPGF